ncbi:AAA family ATPase [Candidatus Viridilinea mediisalina]|uniref:Endonuclease GajA/Old nuclease/RecF-like AAA domain-containing protein n=1 Tax=Candidatus Viridilinea mediisalina TaxID=2024553 RepID=A0A2A6RPB5_9CHLR|nr:AAA family ATPase [Candidatus Viridilinea mediisalina]PDW04709.1 hypothetical protein CJ255_02090 [Candidatus Viridilinea mediisalina]
MKSIRIQNLRSLTDTGYIDLKPITLVVGQNSSGKSTFLRFFPLLRQSIESRTTGPLLWYGRFVDFGSFQEAITKRSSGNSIIFTFDFQLVPLPQRPILFNDVIFDQNRLTNQRFDIRFSLNITGNAKQESNWISECVIEFAEEHVIKINFEKNGKVNKLSVNNKDFLDVITHLHGISQRDGFVPVLMWDSPEATSKFITATDQLLKILFNHVSSLVHKNTQGKTILEILSNLIIGSSHNMLSVMKDIKATNTWTNLISNWDTNSSDFIELRDLIIATSIPELLRSCDACITEFAANNRYIAPVRATAERYYRLQDLAVDEVDFQGQNLAMFLRNLTQTELADFSAWTKENFGFSPEISPSSGHVSLQLRSVDAPDLFNLADQGFGYSQILPILTQLWAIVYQRSRQARSKARRYNTPLTFAIEQPELHLHPYLQAQLVDAFIVSIRAAKQRGVDLRLILETHSETIVNRIGNKIHANALSPDDVNVVLFEKATASKPSVVRLSAYDQEGYLTNWPFGFFDPAE